MTHIENIPHILKYGLTHRSSGNADPHYHSIGDASLIDYRSSKMVDVGGIMIALGDYIPFYFGVRMPMLYVIQHGGNYVPDTGCGRSPEHSICGCINRKTCSG